MKWLASTLLFVAFFSFSTKNVFADIWTSGHGDIGAALNAGNLELHFHFENDATGEGGTILAGE